MKIQPHIPIYKRHPNKFIEYYWRDVNEPGFERRLKIARFLDKKGRKQEMTAQVIWKNE